MKKLIIIASAVLAGSPAFASKARIEALGNSRQLVDVQYTFERPYLLHSLGEMATIEWGAKGDAATTHAEGGFLKKHDDSIYGLYLGRKSADFSASALAVTGALTEQNPINLLYGFKAMDLSWGTNLKYTAGKDETGASDKKASSLGASVGVTNGTWEAELVLGLLGKTEVGSENVESKSNYKLGFGYNLSEMMHAYVTTAATKAEKTAGTTTTALEYAATEVGFINTLVKNEDVNFFYGVKYLMSEVKEADAALAAVGVAKGKKSLLPIWMGIEANAASWLVLRASVAQNVLINEEKNATDKISDVDSITFNAGAGLKLGKGMLDLYFTKANAAGTTAQDAGTGNLNLAKDGFLSKASYTYNF